jgi:hypothetical protein
VKILPLVKAHLGDGSPSALLQSGPYCEVTIRELLRWTAQVKQLLAGAGGQAVPAPAASRWQVLADSGYSVYACRFRSEAARQQVLAAMQHSSVALPAPSTQVSSIRVHEAGTVQQALQLDGSSIRFQGPHALVPDRAAVPAAGHLPGPLVLAALAAHQAAIQLLADPEVFTAAGIYRADASWLYAWLRQAAHEAASLQDSHLGGSISASRFASIGCSMYCGRVRSSQLRQQLQRVFTAEFAELVVEQGSDAGEEMAVTVDQQLAAAAHQEAPFVITPRVRTALKAAAAVLAAGEPLLLVGNDGCGKSELLRALAWLVGATPEHLTITPGETGRLAGQPAALTCLPLAVCALSGCSRCTV